MRAGTSKGVFLLAKDLPAAGTAQAEFVERLMGTDTFQMDGLGGGHLLSSKVAIISPSRRKGIDVDYKFIQVTPGRGYNDTISCGNLLAAVGPFAVEAGLVPPRDPTTSVMVHDVNLGCQAKVTMKSPGAKLSYAGDMVLPGSAGAAAPIKVFYTGIVRDASSMWPSGNVVDEVRAVPVTLINGAISLLIVRYQDVGIKELPENLRVVKREIISCLLDLRDAAAKQFGIGLERRHVVPKICLIAPPAKGGTLGVRYFTPHVPHRSLAVTGAITLAAACKVPGTLAAGLAEGLDPGRHKEGIALEHISGTLELDMEFSGTGRECRPVAASLVRTARLLMRGNAFLPPA